MSLGFWVSISRVRNGHLYVILKGVNLVVILGAALTLKRAVGSRQYHDPETGGRWAPLPWKNDRMFISCGLKFLNENSRTVERGGWVLPRPHIYYSESGDLPHYTWAERLLGGQKGSDAQATHRPLWPNPSWLRDVYALTGGS